MSSGKSTLFLKEIERELGLLVLVLCSPVLAQ